MSWFFKAKRLLDFFGGTKELGEETGCAVYDDVKMLVEDYSVQFLLMGFEQWWKERALNRPRNAGGRNAKGGSVPNTLTDAQRSRLNTLDNIIEHNLKETDFSGTLRDLQFYPVHSKLHKLELARRMGKC